MPRPRSLTPSSIAAAALDVIDRNGLPMLSMRAVAGELGVSAMSLYRYVQSRDELEGLVVGAVLREIDSELPPGVDWRASVVTLVERARDAMRSHPSLVPLLLTRRQSSEASVRWGEAMMRALTKGGFEGDERVIAFRTLLSYLIGAIQVDHFGPLSGEGTAALARLPGSEYPFLSETARRARAITAGQEFRNGLDVVVRGLEHRSGVGR
jgi:AcrR family transcriptional regulator